MDFAKLRFIHKFHGYEIGSPTIDYSVEFDGIKRGTHYSDVKLSDKDNSLISKIIPEQYHGDWAFQHLKINSEIPPHTDSGIKCAILFYIETDNCVTTFYKVKTESPKTFKIEAQTDGVIYHENDLTPTGSFIANPNEIWVLNVSSPHSVKHIEKKQTYPQRSAIVLMSSKYSFEEVCGMLRKTGALL